MKKKGFVLCQVGLILLYTRIFRVLCFLFFFVYVYCKYTMFPEYSFSIKKSKIAHFVQCFRRSVLVVLGVL